MSGSLSYATGRAEYYDRQDLVFSEIRQALVAEREPFIVRKKRRISPRAPLRDDPPVSAHAENADVKARSANDENTPPEAHASATGNTSGIFGRLRFVFVPAQRNGARKFRMDKVEMEGGIILEDFDDSVSYIVVDKEVVASRILNKFGWDAVPAGVNVVKDIFVPECLLFGKLLNPRSPRYTVTGLEQSSQSSSATCHSGSSLEIKSMGSRQPQRSSTQTSSTASTADSEMPSSNSDKLVELMDYVRNTDSLTETDFEEHERAEAEHHDGGSEGANMAEIDTGPSVPIRGIQNPFEKEIPSDSNPNSETIFILENTRLHYKEVQDQWRELGYRKAISTLRRQSHFVKTKQEALRLGGIGASIAEDIEEIVRTGQSRRYNILKSEEDSKELSLFLKVYGAGPVVASKWVRAGFRTLNDVLDKQERLTAQQKIGILLYDDLQRRIPRPEVEEHLCFVRQVLQTLQEDVQLHAMGSFRRGSVDCGDIDFVIMGPNSPDSEQIQKILKRLLSKLRDIGYIKHDLAPAKDESSSKWHGIVRLKHADGVHRRADFQAVPWKERGAAFIYFTGNDIFNRSLRLLASQMGYRLNQHGLFADVLVGKHRRKVTQGRLVAAESEREIFEILKVPYREPEQRNC